MSNSISISSYIFNKKRDDYNIKERKTIINI